MKYIVLSILLILLILIIGKIFFPIKIGRSRGLSIDSKDGKSFLTKKDNYI